MQKPITHHSRLDDWSIGRDNHNVGRVFMELSAPNTYQTVTMTTEQARELAKTLLRYAKLQENKYQ